MESKGKGKSGKNDDSSDSPNNNPQESPHPKKDRNKSRLRRHRRGESSVPPDSANNDGGLHGGSHRESDVSKKSQQRRKKKRKKKRSSRATTATGTTEESSDWSRVSRKLGSRLAAQERRKGNEGKPKELSERDLVEWMRKMVPFVDMKSPFWNKWTAAPLYHFIRNPQAVLCIAFLVSNDDGEVLENKECSTSTSVLHRLQKVCKGPLITLNQLLPDYRGDFFYFLKIQPVPVDGLNYEEIVIYGNVPVGSPDGQHAAQALNNLLVHYWTPILMTEEFLPLGLKDQVYTELNTVLCTTQTSSHFLMEDTENELLLYVPPEIRKGGGNPFEMARDKELCSRLEETVIYWLGKLKQCLVQHGLDDSGEMWPGPLEEIWFWQKRTTNLKNVLVQIQIPTVRQLLKTLAIAHSPYLLELKSTMEQVSASYQEASSNAHYLYPLHQPLEKLRNCKLREIPVEMQKFLWLTLTIWRNSPFYSTPARLNGLLRKFSNSLIVQCSRRIKVKEMLQRRDISERSEQMLKNCLKCLKWWRQIYDLTEIMHRKGNPEKSWIFDPDHIFVHVGALILRISDLLEIYLTTKLYIQGDALPLYPGIEGPYITAVMKTCGNILSIKLDELTGMSELVLNVKDTLWHQHMIAFRSTVMGMDMSVQNCLEKSFDQMTNLKQKLDLMQLFHKFYNKREIITRQIDKLSIKLYEYFEQDVLRLRHLFEGKVVCLPNTFTVMAGRGAWADFMKRRIDCDLDLLKKAEGWLPKTSGVGFQNLVRSEAKSLSEAFGSYAMKCYEDWAREFQMDGHGIKEDLRGRLEMPLLIRGRKGGGGVVNVNLDRLVYRNLMESEMWGRMGKSVPQLLLLTVYPWREKLHGLRENVGMIAKWYNKCVDGLSRDERLLFKDRLMPVEKKVYCCLAEGQWTWTSVRTADYQFVENFKEIAIEVVEGVAEYREATRKVAEIIAKICDSKMVNIKKGGGNSGQVGGVYDGVDEFKEDQNGRIEKELRKVVKGYREIGRILRELFTRLFRADGVEVKVQWEKYVALVDSCVEEALKWSARRSLEILEEVIGAGDKPVFRVNMMLEGGEVRFEPDLERLAGTVLGVHGNLGKALEPLVKLGRFLGTGGKIVVGWGSGGGKKKGGYTDALLKDKECLEIQEKLKFSIERCVSEVNLYAERWIPYRDIWEADMSEFMKNYEKQWPDMQAYERDLKRYMEISEIVYGADSMVTICWLQVDCTKLKQGISELSSEWFQVMAGNLYAKAKDKLLNVYNHMEEKREALSKEPKTLHEQLEMWKVVQEVKGEMKQKIVESFPGIKERFQLLRKYKFEMEPNVEENEVNVDSNWRKYLRFLKESDIKLEGSWGRLKEAFLREADNFKQKAQELQKFWEREGPFSTKDEEGLCENAITQLENFGNDVIALKQEELDLTEALKTFNIIQVNNQAIMELESDMKGLNVVWNLVKEWEHHWNTWKILKVQQVDTEAIEKVSLGFMERFMALNKLFETKSWRAIQEMIDFVNVVKGSLKCCIFLRQQSLKDRHWEWVNRLIKKNNSSIELNDLPNELTLHTVVSSKLHLLLGPISEISWSSEKEIIVEQTLGKIQDFWENENFLLKRLQWSSEIPFEIERAPDLHNTLMDHLVSLTAMKGSRYVGTFKDKVDQWEVRLQNVNVIFEILLDTQKDWLLLDKVFSKEQVQRDMPGATRKFSIVTNVWASVLLIVTQMRNMTRVLNETENLLEMLEDLQGKMEGIRTELGIWLDERRQEFPRFWFVPNQQLVECMGGTLEDYVEVMKMVFGNFGDIRQFKVEGTRRVVIRGIFGKAGGGGEEEELELVKDVEVTGRSVESLFRELKESINLSVKENLKGCVYAFGGKFEEFLMRDGKRWTEQSLQTAFRIHWTQDVARAIQINSTGTGETQEKNELTLKKVIKKLKQSVQKIAQILREQDNSEDDGRKIKGILVTLLHLRDVTEKLHARNCGDLESFEWLQYLRWYWSDEEENCFVKQGFTTVAYGLEYCGGGEGNMVITPTTERCFLALTTAIGFQMGGYIHGSRNSGKQETIKELGLQLGKYVINLSVGPNTTYGALSGCITGIVASGAWAVLKSIDQCEAEVRNMVLSKLGLIAKAKMEFHDKILLEGVEVTLNRDCIIFAVIIGGGGGATCNTKSETFLAGLKSVMRPVSLIQPDAKNILDVKLFLGGFENSAIVSKKIENVFINAREHPKLRNRNKGTFSSLTSMEAVVQRAVQLRKTHTKKLSENEAVIKALELVIMPALMDEKDRETFLDLVKSQFPAVEQVASLKGDTLGLEKFVRESFQELGYQLSEKMVQYCLSLYELVKVYQAVVIFGKTGCGKSVVRKVLKNALLKMHSSNNDNDDSSEHEGLNEENNDSFIKEYIINLASVEGTTDLFGETSSCGKWRDGILTQILKCQRDEENGETGLLWVVFDGPIDTCWVPEEIIDLCGDGDAITLANCGHVSPQLQISTFFEVDNLEDASPGLVAKCGVLFIEDDDDKDDNYENNNELQLQRHSAVWKLYLNAWLNSLTDSFTKAELSEYVEHVLEKSLNFRFEYCFSHIPSVNTIQLVAMFVELFKSFLREESVIRIFEENSRPRFSLVLKQLTAFSIVWSVFIGLDEESQQKASAFLKDLDPLQVYPAKRTVFDYLVQVEHQKWMRWDNLPNLEESLEINVHKNDEFIRTIDVVKAEYLLMRYSFSGEGQRPVLICGPSDSGKSKFIQATLESSTRWQNEQNMALYLQMTPKMTARSVQSMIETRLEPVSSFALAPASGKFLMVIIDDLNAGSTKSPSCTYGEFLRYLMEYWMWYDLATGAPVAISNTRLVAAMTIMDKPVKIIPTRLQSKFSVVYLPSPDEFQIRRIYTPKAKGKLNNFVPPVKLLADDITVATLDIYKLISTELNSGSDNPFQFFSIHDISRVYEGLFRAHKEIQDTKLEILKLWFHECIRVFHDRLMDPNCRDISRDILEKQLYKHFDISVASLFMSSSEYNRNGRVGIFGNFMKDNKRYQEMKDESQNRKLIEDHLRRNVILNGRRPVIVFRKTAEEVTKLARVISQKKGHLLIYGDDGQGRETLCRIAASLYKFQIFEIPTGYKESTGVAFRNVLKSAYRTCAEENVGCCLILKDNQITEDILDTLIVSTGTTVEIPGLFSKKEVAEIRKRKCSIGENEKGDDGKTNMMTWFKDMVENNFHVILCIRSSEKEIFSQRCTLLKQMTVIWFDIWSRESYLEVANILNKTDMKTVEENKSTCQSLSSKSIFHSIHKVAVEEETGKVITPMHFVDFMQLYNWYHEKANEEIVKRIKLFRNAIQEITGVRAKIGTLTEQANLAEKKAHTSRKECEKMLEIIRTQESDAKVQEILVNQQNGQLEEEIKEYEDLAKIIKEEWSDALGDFEKTTEVLQDLADDDLTHIRSYYSPPPLVSRVLDAVMIMLDKETNWPEAKIALGHPGFIKSITEYDKDRISMEKLNNLRKFIQNKEFTPEDVSKYSNGARILCAWIHSIEKYGRCYLSKIAPKREKMENSEQSILEHKHTLMLASDKLMLLRENLSEIQTIYETKWQLKESMEEDSTKCSDVLARAKCVLKLLEDAENEDGQNCNHVKKWKQNLVELETRLENLEGDALLFSACVAYLGPFGQNDREKMKNGWIREVADFTGVKINQINWRAERVVEFDGVETRERLQACMKQGYCNGKNGDEAKVEYHWLVENLLIAKKSLRPVLYVDPHGINEFGNHHKNLGVVVVEVNSLSKLLELYKSGPYKKNNDQDEIECRKVYVTKEMKPEFGRGITSRFSVVNFTLSQQGLKKYFIRKITQLVCPEEETKLQSLVQSALADESRNADLLENIPKLVISCGEISMLNNGNFPETLSKWQEEIEQTELKLVENETEIKEIEKRREDLFSCAANHFTRMFQAVNSLSLISPVYEISLEFFTGLVEKFFCDEFSHSLESEDKEETKSRRKNMMEKMITFLGHSGALLLFTYLIKSVLEIHRYQFALLLCIKTLLDECQDYFHREQLQGEIHLLFENQQLKSEQTGLDNIPIDWLTSNQILRLSALSKQPVFQGLLDSILEKDSDTWKVWVKELSQPETNIPAIFTAKLTAIQTLLIISTLRPDRLQNQILIVVSQVLGREYADSLASPNFINLQEIYYDTMKNISSFVISTTPIMLLLDNNEDVMNCNTGRTIPDPQPSILALAKSVKPPQKLYTLSLSKLNASLADKLIVEGKSKGFWVYLANCHMCSEEWLWEMEKMLKQIKVHRNFKLWMSLKYDLTLFPGDIHRNSIKVAVESPSTMGLCMARLQQKMSGLHQQQKAFSSEQQKHLLNGLCYLHCQLSGRKGYKEEDLISEKFPLVQDIDLEVSVAILKIFVQKYSMGEEQQHFPWWAVKYMLEIQYGNQFATENGQVFVRDLLNQIFRTESRNIDFPSLLPNDVENIICQGTNVKSILELYGFQNIVNEFANTK